MTDLVSPANADSGGWTAIPVLNSLKLLTPLAEGVHRRDRE